MELRTERSVVTVGNKERPILQVAITPRSSPGYLVVGIVIGLVAGLAIGVMLAPAMGDRGLALAQALWNRLSGVSADGERVHFEWLLQ